MKLKINKLQLIGICTLSIMLCSCTDYLNVSSNDAPTAEDLYNSPKQCEQGILGVYSNLRPLSNDEYLMLSEVRSDNVWVNATPDGYRSYSEIGTFRADAQEVTFNNCWADWYRVVSSANIAIQGISRLTFNETYKNQLLGEAYFLRGWAYFELARLFGNVPIIDKVMSPKEVAQVGLSNALDVYNTMVIPDLKNAENLLPLTKDMKDAENNSVSGMGRADKIAAKAMLGRAYMTLSGYPLKVSSAEDSAEVKLKEVLDFAGSNGMFWAPDSTAWKKQWISENNNKYSIFAIQYRSGGSGNQAIFNFSKALPPSYTNQRMFINEIYLEKSLVYEFTKKYSSGNTDARGEGTSMLSGYDAEPNFPAYPSTFENVTIAGVGSFSVQNNAMFYKYMNSFRKRDALGYTASIEAGMKDFNDWPVNYPVIRLEDLQLLYAEILVNKHSDIAGAMAIVNKIRVRMGCDAETALSPSDAMDNIKRERRVEFAGEGIRWFDQVRYGEWQTDIINMFNSYNNPAGTSVNDVKTGRYIYPIPYTQMTIAPGLYNQNADY